MKLEHVLTFTYLNEINSNSSIHSNTKCKKGLNSQKKKNKNKKKEKGRSTKKEENSTDNEMDKSPIFKFEFYGQNNILQNYNVVSKKISSKSNSHSIYKSENHLSKKNKITSSKTNTMIEDFSNSNKKENVNLVNEDPQNRIKFIDGKIISYSTSNKCNILFDTQKKSNDQ